jgi:hypothetical protein
MPNFWVLNLILHIVTAMILKGLKGVRVDFPIKVAAEI